MITRDPVTALMFYVIGGLLLVTALAGVAELLDARRERRWRDQARAAARAKRMEGADQSDASSEFSWSEQPYG